MKKIIQYTILLGLMISSFYITNKAALFAKNSNPIMKNINEIKESVQVLSINAEIDNEYIIPGLNGLEVNTNASFNKMRPYHIFNEYYLIYDQIKPKISLEDNKNKIIINGNKTKQEISLIIENEYHKELLDQYKIKYSMLTTIENYNKNNEVINNENEKFQELENKLNKDSLNKKICIIESNVNIKQCRKKEYYLVKPQILKKDNIIEIKNKLDNGLIIRIDKRITNEELKLIIDYIKNKNLKIVYLSELINEKNNQTTK